MNQRVLRLVEQLLAVRRDAVVRRRSGTSVSSLRFSRSNRCSDGLVVGRRGGSTDLPGVRRPAGCERSPAGIGRSRIRNWMSVEVDAERRRLGGLLRVVGRAAAVRRRRRSRLRRVVLSSRSFASCRLPSARLLLVALLGERRRHVLAQHDQVDVAGLAHVGAGLREPVEHRTGVGRAEEVQVLAAAIEDRLGRPRPGRR